MATKDLYTAFKNPESAERDVTNLLTHFSDLRPKSEFFVFNDGTKKKLVKLSGTILVTYKGAEYNIPIKIWLMDTHPYNPPMVYVDPTCNMQIKQGRNVDSNGKIDIPYLREWRFPNSDLVGMVQLLTVVFGETPPVYKKVCKRPEYPKPPAKTHTMQKTTADLGKAVVKQPQTQNFGRSITGSDVNDIIRSYGDSLPRADRQVLQALRSAMADQEYNNVLDDVQITIHLDKSGDDHILTSSSDIPKHRILAHRNGWDNVEIKLNKEKPVYRGHDGYWCTD